MRRAAIVTAVLFAVMDISGAQAGEPPRAVQIARTTTIPGCTSFVDAASKGGEGTAQAPHKEQHGDRIAGSFKRWPCYFSLAGTKGFCSYCVW